MISSINKRPRLFSFIVFFIVTLIVSLIWVFGLYPLLDVNSTGAGYEKAEHLTVVFLTLTAGMFIPAVISFIKVGRLHADNIYPLTSNISDCTGEELLLEAIDRVPAGIVMYDSNDRLIVCNTMFCQIWGYSLSDTISGITHQELGLIDQQRGVKVAGVVAEEYMESRLKYRSVFSEEQVLEMPDGRLISTKDRPLAAGGFISVQTDITELVTTRNRYHKSEQQLLDAIEGLDEGFVSFDTNDQLVIANSNYRKMYPAQEGAHSGMSFEDMIKLSVYAGEITAATDCEEEWIGRRLQQHNMQLPIDEQLLSNDIWLRVSERRTENGGVVCIYTDISEIKKNQAILELYATTDEMTGILNRRTGLLMLNKLMAQFERTSDNLSICYFDIDELKEVNDEFGHESGDMLIKSITQAAKEATREGDIIMRLGGDEFLIVFTYCSVKLAHSRMEAIKQQLKKTIENEKKPYTHSFSYGIVAYLPEKYNDVEEFVAHADKLMYQNKLDKKD